MVTKKSETLPSAYITYDPSAAYHPPTGKIYIFGWYWGEPYYDSKIIEYDPQAGTVTRKSEELPTPRHSSSAAYHPGTGKIYVFGGWISNRLSDIIEYDPQTGTVIKKSETLPTARDGTSAAYHPGTGKIYVFGGRDSGPLSDIIEYDPQTGTVIKKSETLPTARQETSAAYHPGTGKIYIFGGSGSFLSDIIEYDPETGNVVKKTETLPTGRWATSCAYNSSNNKIYIFGGWDGSSYFSDIIEYDPQTETVIKKSETLPTGREKSSAVYHSETEKIYIFSGDDGGYYDIVEYAPSCYETGDFVSPVKDCEGVAAWGNISWTKNLPVGTDLVFKSRTGNTGIPGATWSPWSTDLTISTGSIISSPSARYIQCKAIFTSTITAQTPVLYDFIITYNCSPSIPTNSSPSVGESLPRETKNPAFSWSAWVDADGDSQQAFQVQLRVGTGNYGDANSKDSGEVVSSASSFTPSDFNLVTGTYYWHVRVKDGSGFDNAWSQWSNETAFYIQNNSPVLSWTNETGYTSGGLDPETGDISTTFIYLVKYTDTDNDAPKSGYPKLRIKKGFPGQSGSEISGSPFIMNYVSGNYNTGAIYSYSIKLEPGQYTYYFEAYDIYDAKATGEPINEKSGPGVISKLPETKEMKVYHGVFRSGENEKCYVSFNLEKAGETTIKVYNSIGREVKELYRGTATLGLNIIPWDGTDENGSKVSSGVYIIRIESPGIKQQKRVVVVR